MFDKYDERPGFESYNSVNFPYPAMMPMMPTPNINNNTSCQKNVSNLENRINNLENRINNLENRVQKLENNMYPKAVDYSQTYQNSMNMM